MARNPFLDGALRVVRDVAGRALDRATRPSARRRTATGQGPRPTASQRPAGTGYPGDYTGRPEIVYDPHPDGRPDPGEVVWTWVPYEDDHAQGKDRPVLLIGQDAGWLLGLPATSKDHDRDAAQEAREGRFWFDIGSGNWDAKGRESEVRLDRIVRVDPSRVRRAAGQVQRQVFDHVVAQVEQHWHR